MAVMRTLGSAQNGCLEDDVQEIDFRAAIMEAVWILTTRK